MGVPAIAKPELVDKPGLAGNSLYEDRLSNKTILPGQYVNSLLAEEGLKVVEYLGEAKPRLAKVVERLYEEAELGKQWAIKEILDRTIGKPIQHIQQDTRNVHVVVVKNISVDEL